MKRKEYILPLLLIIIPVIEMASFISSYGIDIPFWDHWTLVPLLYKLHFGKLTFYDIWEQHVETREFFPKIIMLAIAYVSRWNIWWELYTNLLFGIGILYSIYLLLSHTLKNYNRKIILYLTGVISFLVFSPSQWLSYIQGWKFQVFLATLSPLVAVLFLTLYPEKKKGIIVAIISTVIGSYSFLGGFSGWLSTSLLLFFQSRKNWKYIFIWYIAMTVSILCYFYKFTKFNKDFLIFFHFPLHFISYIFAYIGAPLSPEKIYLSIPLGIFLTGLLCGEIIIAWRYWKESFYRILPWISFALYVILTAIITAIGRLLGSKGPEIWQAHSSHYTTVSTLFTISTFVVTVICIENYLREQTQQPVKLAIVFSSIGTFLFLSYFLTFFHGINRMQEWKKSVEIARYCLFHPDKCDMWKYLHSDPKYIIKGMEMLEQTPFNPFR